MNNYLKVTFNEKESLLNIGNVLSIKVCIQIGFILKNSIQLDESVEYTSKLLDIIYDNKKAIEKCIREFNFEDENLQKICKDFVFEYLVYKNYENKFIIIKVTKEKLLKELGIIRQYGINYIFFNFYRFYPIQTIEFLDVSNDTLYINYELYNSSKMKNDFLALIKYKNEIEEYINNNHSYDKLLGKHVSDFKFTKINIHVD